jgi:large subunit ribosomal protein L3
MVGLIGNKVGSTQVLLKDGKFLQATLIKISSAIITGIKTKDTHGYDAVQVGFQSIKESKLSQGEKGNLNKSTNILLKVLKEYKVNDTDHFKLGAPLTIDYFKPGQFVDIRGYSIGKGYSGTIKRHNFSRGPMTHGSKNHRAPGSIGQGSTPGRVFPNKKMPGQQGNRRVSISNLEILEINKKYNLVVLKGSIPGKMGNLVNIVPSNKLKFSSIKVS